MQYGEEEMQALLSEQLLPGETLAAAVYGTFSDTGFFASRIPAYGFLGITDSYRLIGCQLHLAGKTAVSADLNFAKKLTVSAPFLGSLFKQKEIYAECLGERTVRLKFTVLRKMPNRQFPHHTENAETLLRMVEKKIQQLHL